MRDIASIIGLKVITIQEGREVGVVSQVIVDLSSGTIEGMIIGSGAAEKGLAADDIQVIGTDAVMIATHRLARPLSELPQLLERRREVDAAPRAVITDTGKRLGTLGTIYVDPMTRRVTRYEISGGAWRDMTDGVLSMAPVEGTVDGRDSLVIPAALLVSLGANSGGLKSRIGKLGESAKQQGKQAAESLSEGAASVKRGVANVAEKATQVGGKLREEAVEATSKVKEEAGELGAKIKEGAARAGEAAQNLGEKVKDEASGVGEGAQNLGEKVKEEASEVGAKIKEGVIKAGEVAQNLGEKVKEEAGELGAKIKEGAAKAGEVAQNLGEKVKDEASEAGEKLREGATAIGAHFHRDTPDAENAEESAEAENADAKNAAQPEQICGCGCEVPAEECVCTLEECAECESTPCCCPGDIEPCYTPVETAACYPGDIEPCCTPANCAVCGSDPCVCAPGTDIPATETAPENEAGPEKSK